MSRERIELQIDILSTGKHRAHVLPTITVGELVDEIIKEFGQDEGLLHLNQGQGQLELLHQDGDSIKPLTDTHKPLRELLGALGSRQSYNLQLQEKSNPIPQGTQAVRKPIYLQEQESGQVYKLPWSPAIIGRIDRNKPGNERVVVNLEQHPMGQRVSRRHLQITAENGQYQLEVLAQNPTHLLRGEQDDLLEKGQKVLLQNGDVIFLERSQIKLEFLEMS